MQALEIWRNSCREGLRRMGDTIGRATPREFWPFAVTLIVIYIGLHILDERLFPEPGYYARRTSGLMESFKSHLLSNVFRIVVLLPFLTAITRRLNDAGRSTWLMRIWIVLWLGTLFVTVGNTGYLGLIIFLGHIFATIGLFVLLCLPSAPVSQPNTFD